MKHRSFHPGPPFLGGLFYEQPHAHCANSIKNTLFHLDIIKIMYLCMIKMFNHNIQHHHVSYQLIRRICLSSG